MKLFLLLACFLMADVNGYRGFYEYDIQSAIGTPHASDQHAVLQIKTKVQIKSDPSQPDDLVVKMFNTIVTLDAASMLINPDVFLQIDLVGQPLPRVQTIVSETLSRYLVTFRMRDGKVALLKHDKRDPYWSVNIKKGLVSLLQYQPQSQIQFSSNDQAVLNTTMPTTNGLCDTIFAYQKRFVEQEPIIEATAQPNFDQCIDPVTGLKNKGRSHLFSGYATEECQGSCEKPFSLVFPMHSIKYQLHNGATGMEMVSAQSTNVHSILAGRQAQHGASKLTIRQELGRVANVNEANSNFGSIDEGQFVQAAELLVAIMPTDIPKRLSQNENIMREAAKLHRELSATIMNDASLNEDVPRLTHALLKLMTRMSKDQLIHIINHSAKFAHGKLEPSWPQCKRVMAHIIDMLPAVATTDSFHTILYLIEQSTKPDYAGIDNYIKLVVDESRIRALLRGFHTWKNLDVKMLTEIMRVVQSSKFKATYFLPSVSSRIQVFRAAWLSIGSLSNTIFAEQLSGPANMFRFYSHDNRTNEMYLQNHVKNIFDLSVGINSQLVEMLKEPATHLLAIKSMGNTGDQIHFDVLMKYFKQTSDQVVRQTIISSMTPIIRSTANRAYNGQWWMRQTNYLSETPYGKLIKKYIKKFNIHLEQRCTQLVKMHDFILMIIRDESQAPSIRFEALKVLISGNADLPTLTAAIETIRTMPDSKLRRLAISLLVDVSKRVDPCVMETTTMLRQLLKTFTPTDLKHTSQFLMSKGFHHKSHAMGTNFFIAAMMPENSFIPSHMWLKSDYIDHKVRTELLEVTVSTQDLHKLIQSLRDNGLNTALNMNDDIAKRIDKLRLQMADESDNRPTIMVSVKMFGREVSFFEPSTSEMKQIIKSPKKYLSSVLRPMEDIHMVKYYIQRNPTLSGLLFATEHMVMIRPHIYIDTNVQTTSWVDAVKRLEVTIRPHLHYIDHAKLSVECGPIEAAMEAIYPISITPNAVQLTASFKGNEFLFKWKRMTNAQISLLQIKTIMQSSVRSIPAEIRSDIPTDKSFCHVKHVDVQSTLGVEKRQWNDEWVSPFFGLKTEVKIQMPRNNVPRCIWSVPMKIVVNVKPSSFNTDSHWVELRGKFTGDISNPDSRLTTSAKVSIGSKTIFSIKEVFFWNGEHKLAASGDIRLQTRKIKNGDLSSHMQNIAIKYDLKLPNYLDYDMSVHRNHKIHAGGLPSLIDNSREIEFMMRVLQSDREREFLKVKITGKPFGVDHFSKISPNELRKAVPFLSQCLKEQKNAISKLDSKYTPSCIQLYFHLNSLNDVTAKAELRQTAISQQWKSTFVMALQYVNSLLFPYLKRSQASSSDETVLVAQSQPFHQGTTLLRWIINTPHTRNQYSMRHNYEAAPLRTATNLYVNYIGSQRFESNECKIVSNHIRTFDDLIYRLPKSDIVREFSSDKLSPHLATVCDMLVAKDCSSGAKFFVTLKQKFVDGEMHSMYTVRILGTTVVSKPGSNGRVQLWVNGVMKQAYVDKFVEIKKLPSASYTYYSIYSSALGIRVIVGSIRGRVFRLQLSPLFYSRVCGMCGNNNGISSDEFSVPSLNQYSSPLVSSKLHGSMVFLMPSKSSSVCQKIRNYADGTIPKRSSLSCTLQSNGAASDQTWNRVIDLRGKRYTPFSSSVNAILRRSDCGKLVVLREQNGLEIFTNIDKDILVRYNRGAIRIFSDNNRLLVDITTSQERKSVSIEDIQDEPIKYKFLYTVIKISKIKQLTNHRDTLAVQVQIITARSPVATIIYTSLEARVIVPNRMTSYNGICACNTQQNTAPYNFLQAHLSVAKVSECLKDVSPRYSSHRSSCRIVPGVVSPQVEAIDSLRLHPLSLLSFMTQKVPKLPCPIMLAKGRVFDEVYKVYVQSLTGKPTVVLSIGEDKYSATIVKTSKDILSVEVMQQGNSLGVRRLSTGKARDEFDLFGDDRNHAFTLFKNNHLYITGMQKSDHVEIAMQIIRNKFLHGPWNKASAAKVITIRVITWTNEQDSSVPTIAITPNNKTVIETGLCSLTARDLSKNEVVMKTFSSLTSDERCSTILQSTTVQNRFCRIAVTNKGVWVTPFKVFSLQKVYERSNNYRNPGCPIALAKFTFGSNKIKMWYEHNSKWTSSISLKIETDGGVNVIKFSNKKSKIAALYVNEKKVTLVDDMKIQFGALTITRTDMAAHSTSRAMQVTLRVPGVMEMYAILPPSSTTIYFRSLTDEHIDSGVCAMNSAASISDIFALYHEPLDSSTNCQRYRPFNVYKDV